MYFTLPNKYLKIDTPKSTNKNTSNNKETNTKNNVVSIETAKKQ